MPGEDRHQISRDIANRFQDRRFNVHLSGDILPAAAEVARIPVVDEDVGQKADQQDGEHSTNTCQGLFSVRIIVLAWVFHPSNMGLNRKGFVKFRCWDRIWLMVR